MKQNSALLRLPKTDRGNQGISNMIREIRGKKKLLVSIKVRMLFFALDLLVYSSMGHG